ncbi:F420-dependent glucose-6-phosphate dehydrogenase [Legionella beliardensis]|uniref:F420-dependent glucose-6-phosphate dehydrogenase n=1 Tax=Legionella beliardensis TaxID=91822 RepID=A0A378I6Z4_9GAMM|nr:TIGR03885 family FMN-dependent LLM class oxidoreductase [Legionella beliardensis]STX28214.1 F420-dependent glucose-6-phosphate dehydrogenase [Legionella beliardensis]
MDKIKFGYHVSHEQFSPTELLDYVKQAEKAGFDFAFSSDHFHPWNRKQGNSAFSWAWLGAAMSQTSFEYGLINCPTFRYHPAMVAQAAATIDMMFPERFWLCVGSGQALNEAITGQHWPNKHERNARLKEAATIIKALWRGETVTHKGLLTIEEATLYTQPRNNTLPLFGAAITPETAAWLASWADGLVTVSQPIEQVKAVVASWQKNGGQNKPMILKVQLSYDHSQDAALKGAFEQWKSNIFGSSMLSELRTPEQFEQAAALIQPEQLYDYVTISASPKQHIHQLEEYIALGFKKIVLHNVNTSQTNFILNFGNHVLNYFK